MSQCAVAQIHHLPRAAQGTHPELLFGCFGGVKLKSNQIKLAVKGGADYRPVLPSCQQPLLPTLGSSSTEPWGVFHVFHLQTEIQRRAFGGKKLLQGLEQQIKSRERATMRCQLSPPEGHQGLDLNSLLSPTQ